MHRIRSFFIVFALVSVLYNAAFSSVTVDSSEEPVNVLILNSYHFTYPWTFDQNTGITEYLSQVYPNAVIYTEFLDWKRFPDPLMIDSLTKVFEEKYTDTPFDLILTTDDMALTYALEHRRLLFSNAPIAFSGIIESTATEIIGNHTNVTGVYEKMDPLGAITLLHILQPDVTKIYLVHDLSESGIRTAKTLTDAIDAYKSTKNYEVQDLSQENFSQLLTTSTTLNEDSVIFMVSYNISTDNVKNKPEDFANQLSLSSNVPIYSVDEYLLGSGILGGTFLSGELQGKQLGKLGAAILRGTSPNDLPNVSDATVYTAVDDTILRRFDLNASALDPKVKHINQRFSFYETYKSVVWITICIISVLLFLITLLTLNIKRRYRYELELLSNKDELQNLYEIVQASEEELIAQNEELESYQEQLRHDAHYDALTGLPNRFYLNSFYQDLYEMCDILKEYFVLFFIDLNNFRYINNTHGHSFGDQLLKIIAQRLSHINDTLISVRLGGDEFIVLAKINKTDYDTTMKKIITQIHHLFSLPYQVNNLSIPISASIGYSLFPDDGNTIDELIAQSDMAMYEIKKEKKPYAKRFNHMIKTKYDDAISIISNFKEAYENQEFSLYYQPQIELTTTKIVGFEALLRWRSPNFGEVPPDRFIPLAESCGFIKTLGHCVLKTAIENLKILQQTITHPFKISINVSVVQLFEDNFVNEVNDILLSENVDPSYLQFEITESVMIESYDIIIERLNAIKDLGISLSLDDFGTGYSSLVYLHYLPISELKIDKIFIDEITSTATQTDGDDQCTENNALVSTILTLAKASKLCVVAEGVESKEQITYLEQQGCDRIQGYVYSKPLPLPEVIVFCEQSRYASYPY